MKDCLVLLNLSETRGTKILTEGQCLMIQESHIFWRSLEPCTSQHQMYAALSIYTLKINTFIATTL